MNSNHSCAWSLHSEINHPQSACVCRWTASQTSVREGGIEHSTVLIVWLKNPPSPNTPFSTHWVKLWIRSLLSNVICCNPTTIKTCTSTSLVLWILFVSVVAWNSPSAFRCQKTLASDELVRGPFRNAVERFELFWGKWCVDFKVYCSFKLQFKLNANSLQILITGLCRIYTTVILLHQRKTSCQNIMGIYVNPFFKKT